MAHADLLLVGGEHVALAEGIETPAMSVGEELGVVVADVGDLVEREYYGIVQSHEQDEEGGDMRMTKEKRANLYFRIGGMTRST